MDKGKKAIQTRHTKSQTTNDFLAEGSKTPGNRGVRLRHFWHDEQAEAVFRGWYPKFREAVAA
jgi:hypothetical protein